jgi:NADH-quinone oxidoreductase subunit E
MKEAETLASWIGKELGIGPGETTADGRFSFELTNCIGACDQAPAMLIDDEVYGRLTSERISEILTSYD